MDAILPDLTAPAFPRLMQSAQGGRMRISAKLADEIEQLLAIIFYGFFCQRFVLAILAGTTDPRVFAVLIADGTILVLLLVRRSTGDISLRVGDWIWALVGTLAGLLLSPEAVALAPNTGLALVLAGTAVAVAAKFSLGRSFGLVAANRGVQTGGLYRLVRHPIYAGYLVTHVGTLLLLPNWWNALLYAVVWTALGGRIAAEERLLTDDPVYAAYRQRTRWRLIPGIV